MNLRASITSPGGYSAQLPPDRFNLTRYCLKPAADKTPSKVALIVVSASDEPVSARHYRFGEIEDAVLRVSQGLRDAGFERGDRLFIRMGNSFDYALLFFSAIAAGVVPIPASTMLSVSEVSMILEDSGASGIAVDGSLDVPRLPPPTRVVNASDLARMKAGARGDYADTAADDPAYLIYTSGTSGVPKGVLHAHRAVWGRRPMYDGWYGLGQQDIILHTGAFNWTYTLGTGLSDPWANGATSVLYTGMRDIEVWPRLIETFKPTLMASVPALYRQILKYCNVSKDAFAPMRHCLVAGEPLSPALAQAWQEATGLVLYEALGMSEISTYISCSPDNSPRPGSAGRPQEGRCVAILPAEDGDVPVPVGETGLIAVHRSDPGLMLGYWNRPEEDAHAYRGNWFIGGDRGRFDEDGYVYFSGRNDDVMNALGYRVSPQEVENALGLCPMVGEVGVTDIEVREGVRVIAAFVVLAEGQRGDEQELLDHAKERLANYKLPRAIYFVEALPHTANGKLKRKALHTLL